MPKLEIFDNSLIKLIVRKGPNSDRIGAVLAEGEPGYTVDTKRFFIGDGTTSGGNVVGNKFLGYATDLTSLPTVPGVIGDIAYKTSNSTLYYIQSGSGSIVDDWIDIASNINTVEYDGLYTAVQPSSANWNLTHATVQSSSANWNNAFTTANSVSATVATLKFPIVLPLVTLGEGVDMRDNGVSKFAPFSFIVTKVFASTREIEGGDITFEIYKNGSAFPSPGLYANIDNGSAFGTLLATPSPPITITLGDELTIIIASVAAGFINADNIEIWLEGYIPKATINTFLL